MEAVFRLFDKRDVGGGAVRQINRLEMYSVAGGVGDIHVERGHSVGVGADDRCELRSLVKAKGGAGDGGRRIDMNEETEQVPRGAVGGEDFVNLDGVALLGKGRRRARDDGCAKYGD